MLLKCLSCEMMILGLFMKYENDFLTDRKRETRRKRGREEGDHRCHRHEVEGRVHQAVLHLQVVVHHHLGQGQQGLVMLKRRDAPRRKNI